LRAGESGGEIAPEPIITRKKKESRASNDPRLTATQCPSLSERYPQLAQKLEKTRSVSDGDSCEVPQGTSQGHALAIFDN